MFVISPYMPKIHLIRFTGERQVFSNQEALREFLSKSDIRSVVGKNFQTRSVPDQREDFLKATGTLWGFVLKPVVFFIVRDEFGTVDPWDAIACYRKTFPKKRTYFTGSKRPHRKYYRHPRTTQERRLLVEEGTPPIRSRRNFVNLPNFWDDKPRHIERCWKSHRKHQWKV